MALRNPYPNFAKMLKLIGDSGQSAQEMRRNIVKYCAVDDILLLADVLSDLLQREPIQWKRKS